MSGWDDFWTWAENSQLGANVVGGLIVALIVAVVGLLISIFRKSWRDKIWGNVGRFFKWVGGLRITTHRQRELLRAQSMLVGADAIVATGHAERAEAEVRREEYERGYGDGLAQAAADADAHAQEALDPALPLPPPRWDVTRSNNGDFELRNLMPRSVAREVHIEGDSDLRVTSAGHWPDLSGEAGGIFTGDATYDGQTQGVRFTVAWYDERNARQETTTFLQPWRRDPGNEWMNGRGYPL